MKAVCWEGERADPSGADGCRLRRSPCSVEYTRASLSMGIHGPFSGVLHKTWGLMRAAPHAVPTSSQSQGSRAASARQAFSAPNGVSGRSHRAWAHPPETAGTSTRPALEDPRATHSLHHTQGDQRVPLRHATMMPHFPRQLHPILELARPELAWGTPCSALDSVFASPRPGGHCRRFEHSLVDGKQLW
jgi:hypothetical protein